VNFELLLIVTSQWTEIGFCNGVKITRNETEASAALGLVMELVTSDREVMLYPIFIICHLSVSLSVNNLMKSY